MRPLSVSKAALWRRRLAYAGFGSGSNSLLLCLPIRWRTAYLGRRLVLTQTFIDDWCSKLSSVQVRYLTSATSLGHTQCMRLSTNGDPKRLVRGGGTSSGILLVVSGCSRSQSRSSLIPVPGAAGIDQPSLGIIVGEQQPTEIGPRTFGIGPDDHDKSFAMQALDLDPQTRLTGAQPASARFETMFRGPCGRPSRETPVRARFDDRSGAAVSRSSRAIRRVAPCAR